MAVQAQDGFVGIRRFQPEDVPAHYAAVRESLPELSRWMWWCHPNYSIDETRSFVASCGPAWERGEHYTFVIVDVRDGTILGGVGLNHINHQYQFANLGYWVRTSHKGQGIATAATRLVARFGLRELHFNRLEIVVAFGNVPSQRVAEKAGARREGLLRNRLVHHAQPQDAWMYSLIPEDLSR